MPRAASYEAISSTLSFRLQSLETEAFDLEIKSLTCPDDEKPAINARIAELETSIGHIRRLIQENEEAI